MAQMKPVRPQSQELSHRNLRPFETTNACSNANLTGVSGRGRAFKERLLPDELHFGVFFWVFVMCERTSKLSRGFKEDEQSETGETDSKVAPVCHQGVSEVERQTEARRSIYSLKVP